MAEEVESYSVIMSDDDMMMTDDTIDAPNDYAPPPISTAIRPNTSVVHSSDTAAVDSLPRRGTAVYPSSLQSGSGRHDGGGGDYNGSGVLSSLETSRFSNTSSSKQRGQYNDSTTATAAASGGGATATSGAGVTAANGSGRRNDVGRSSACHGGSESEADDDERSPIMLTVHINQSVEAVDIRASDLKKNPNAILSLLESEECPLSVWYRVARHCYRRGEVSSFLSILESATSDDIEEIRAYTTQRVMRSRLLTLFASYYITQASNAQNIKWRAQLRSAEELLVKAEALLKATSLGPQQDSNNSVDTGRTGRNKSSNSAGDDSNLAKAAIAEMRGFLQLAEYSFLTDEVTRAQKLSRASSYFAVVVRSCPQAFLGKLGLACVQSLTRNYKRALQLYCEVLATHPKISPPNIRTSIGLCNYNLGNYGKAVQAFRRTLELCPRDVNALACLAQMQSTDSSGVRASLHY